MKSAILDAVNRIAPVVTRTPLQYNEHLSSKYNAEIFLKREDLQIVRSFKIRGAFNKMRGMDQDTLVRGVVCASAGNHAQGVAYACHYLKVKGTIFMPTTTPKQKISKVMHFGGEWITIKLTGDTYDDCQKEALNFSEESQCPFIHPFDDVEVIAGQGTIAVEIMEDLNQIDYALIAVGGGGLISGVGSYFKEASPETKIIAIESEGAPAFHTSLNAGEKATLQNIDSFADGIAVKSLGDITFPMAKSVTDKSIIVPEGKICSTILSLYNDEAIVVEPAGAVGIAALDQLSDEIKGKRVVIIVCGGNNDITRTEEIRERALLWENKKHYFIIHFPQRAGALREFLSILGPEDDITHFQYTKKNNRSSGPALVGIELKDPNEFDEIIGKMKERQINYEHVNNNPMLFELLV